MSATPTLFKLQLLCTTPIFVNSVVFTAASVFDVLSTTRLGLIECYCWQEREACEACSVVYVKGILRYSGQHQYSDDAIIRLFHRT